MILTYLIFNFIYILNINFIFMRYPQYSRNIGPLKCQNLKFLLLFNFLTFVQTEVWNTDDKRLHVLINRKGIYHQHADNPSYYLYQMFY
jgi:hypothetical protein